MLVPPPCDAAVQPVEHQRSRCESDGREIMASRMAPHVKQCEQDGRHSASRIGQCEHVGQMELTDHREMLCGHGPEIYADEPGLSMAFQNCPTLSLTFSPARPG